MLQAAASRTSRVHGHRDNFILHYAHGALDYSVVSHHLNALAAFVSQRNCWCGAPVCPTSYIFTAVVEGHTEMVQLLIAAGAVVYAIGS